MCLFVMKMSKENVFVDDDNEVSEGDIYSELSKGVIYGECIWDVNWLLHRRHSKWLI